MRQHRESDRSRRRVLYLDKTQCCEATKEAMRLRHPVYDMLYFVLARRNAATLFTLDRKLQQLCLDNGVDCVLTDTNF